MMPLPAAVADSEFGPATVPRVQDVTVAIPSEPVVMGAVGFTVPLFTTTANVTAIPGTAVPTVACCTPSPAWIAILLADAAVILNAELPTLPGPVAVRV